MAVIKIDGWSVGLDVYVCEGCKIPCVLITSPKPNHCPFGYQEDVQWTEKKMKIEKKGDR